MRVGFGFDSHRLAEGRPLIIGGVAIPSQKGAIAHSDGDALLHAVIDAIFGAMGEADIGTHFPDADPKYKDISSVVLLKKTIEMAGLKGFSVKWVDATVILEAPKLGEFKSAMSENMINAGIKGASVKAKTSEGMGLVGRGEGIAAFAVCVLENI